MYAGDPRLDETCQRVLTKSALAALRAPIGQAHALPNAAYTDPGFLDLENARLFAPNWVLAGFGGRIPDAGDAEPVDVAGVPVILVRGSDGKVRGFQNVCRHRGARLLTEACAARPLITCPYHSWAFDTEGTLRSRPHFDGPGQHESTTDGSGPNLFPVRTESWHDLIFVNVSGTAPPLAEFLRPAVERMTGYDMSVLRYAGHMSFEVEANWKFAVENYIEPYHVFSLHPRLLNHAPMEIRKPSVVEGRCFYNEYTAPGTEEGRGEGLPHWPDLPDEWQRRGLWFHLFPGFSVEIYADQFTVFHIIPTAPDRTREELHFYMIGDAATAPEHEDGRNQVMAMWHDLNVEDMAVLKRLQEGRRAPGYDGGKLSPFWDKAPLAFSRMIAESLIASCAE